MKRLEKKQPSCPEAWASGLLLCPLMRHPQHFALEPVFAGIKKRNRAVEITASSRVPACYSSDLSSRSERSHGGVTVTHMPFQKRKAGRRDRRGMLIEIGEEEMVGGTLLGWGVSEAGVGGWSSSEDVCNGKSSCPFHPHLGLAEGLGAAWKGF